MKRGREVQVGAAFTVELHVLLFVPVAFGSLVLRLLKPSAKTTTVKLNNQNTIGVCLPVFLFL